MRRLLPVPLLLVVFLSTACASGGSDDGGTASGVRGQVLLGPMCPVMQEGSPCPDRPLEDVQVRAIADGKTVAQTTSGSDGRFELALPPGLYTLEAIVDPDGPGMSAKPVDVTVTAGSFADVVVPVDSGIR